MENLFLFHAFLLGIFITFIYDLLRILRRVFPHGNLLISLEDLCFWIYCGIEVFLLMYHESNGVLRWFAVLGAVVGMVLYCKAVSPLFVKCSSWLLRKIVSLLYRILYVLCTPLRFLAKKCSKGKRLLKKKLTYLQKMLKI